ncbi:DUF333 domain-containing protein [Verticiella sediminum]|uniref:DUF333 domain-containing protein n=1 Tax=Verticiella sediminum TaxID=1247510 RepID=A0A556ABC2_9BURK|nr:DUF333 domain-containing protein [Verticiella sediminum]TSH90167.1 DUF333 domain-containing protein [Verticiella sediminum]
MTTIVRGLGAALTAGVVSACSSPSAVPPVAAGRDTQRIGMANPASVYCRSQGGSSVPMLGPRGEYALCRLPDGTREEEWSLYRSANPVASR